MNELMLFFLLIKFPKRNKSERGDSVEAVKVVPVIQTVTKKGSGTENDPYREVVQYWTLDGELLAEKCN